MLTSKVMQILKNNNIENSITIGSIIDGNGVGLFETAGQSPTMYFDKTILERKGLQVIVRNKSYEDGKNIINNIFNLLNIQVGFNPQQSPFYLGRNEKGYAEFSVNYIILSE